MSTKRKTRKEEPRGISFALIESKLDLRKPNVHWEKRRAQGKSLRRKQPRELHAKWLPAKNRPSPLELIDASNRGRDCKAWAYWTFGICTRIQDVEIRSKKWTERPRRF